MRASSPGERTSKQSGFASLTLTGVTSFHCDLLRVLEHNVLHELERLEASHDINQNYGSERLSECLDQHLSACERLAEEYRYAGYPKSHTAILERCVNFVAECDLARRIDALGEEPTGVKKAYNSVSRQFKRRMGNRTLGCVFAHMAHVLKAPLTQDIESEDQRRIQAHIAWLVKTGAAKDDPVQQPAPIDASGMSLFQLLLHIDRMFSPSHDASLPAPQYMPDVVIHGKKFRVKIGAEEIRQMLEKVDEKQEEGRDAVDFAESLNPASVLEDASKKRAARDPVLLALQESLLSPTSSKSASPNRTRSPGSRNRTRSPSPTKLQSSIRSLSPTKVQSSILKSFLSPPSSHEALRLSQKASFSPGFAPSPLLSPALLPRNVLSDRVSQWVSPPQELARRRGSLSDFAARPKSAQQLSPASPGLESGMRLWKDQAWPSGWPSHDSRVYSYEWIKQGDRGFRGKASMSYDQGVKKHPEWNDSVVQQPKRGAGAREWAVSPNNTQRGDSKGVGKGSRFRGFQGLPAYAPLAKRHMDVLRRERVQYDSVQSSFRHLFADRHPRLASPDVLLGMGGLGGVLP